MGTSYPNRNLPVVSAVLTKMPQLSILTYRMVLVDGTPRPANTQLDVRMTEALFEGSGSEGLAWNGFEEWWTAYLRRA